VSHKLPDEIRDAFDREQRTFAPSRGLRGRMLANVAEAGRRRRRHAEWAMGAATVGLAMAVVAVLLLGLRGFSSPTSPASSTQPPTSAATQLPSPPPSPIGGAASPAGSPTAAATQAPTRCHTADLAGSLRPGSPGAGQRYAVLVLTNLSSQTCWVYGYVGMQLFDGAGHPLPTNVIRDPATPATITLQPGDTAFALLHWGAINGVGDSPTAQCQPDPASVQVTPPDETTQLVIPWSYGMVCQQGRIDIPPLAAGTGPSS
jgi:hypothetical protein